MRRRKKSGRLESQLWSDIEGKLEDKPQGVLMDELYKSLDNHKYSKLFFTQFINKMHEEWRIIAYLSSSPIKIAKRPEAIANKLKKKLTKEQYMVYNQIEQTQSDGILMSHLRQNAGLELTKCRKILTKLEKLEVTSRFINPRTKMIKYHATQYQPSSYNTCTGVFYDKNGNIDINFLNGITCAIHLLIKQNKIKGISINNIQLLLKKNKITTIQNGLPLNDIHLILNLLIYDAEIEIIAHTIPVNNLNNYITHSQNTFHHLSTNVNKERKNIINENQDKNKNKKRKLNDINNDKNVKKKRKLNNKKIKVKFAISDDDDDNDNDDDDDQDVDLELKHLNKYNDIKFRSMKYNYDSPFCEIPCQSCPVANECRDDGKINPIDCPYLNRWLELF